MSREPNSAYDQYYRDIRYGTIPQGTIPQNKSDEKKSKINLKVDECQLAHDCHPAKWKIYYAYFILAFALLSHTFELLQAIQIYSQKSAQDVSLPAFILWVVGSVIWFIYGTFVLAIPNWPIIVSSVAAFILGIIIVVGIVLYG
jgi:uncharacterized protein with PQ loop repeat